MKEQKLWQQGLVKEYYSEVTEIIRRYFERRYAVRALEETTDEILERAPRRLRPAKRWSAPMKMLRCADLVKFAKFTPGIPDHEEMLTLAYDIVEHTRPALMSPVANTDAHVGS